MIRIALRDSIPAQVRADLREWVDGLGIEERVVAVTVRRLRNADVSQFDPGDVWEVSVEYLTGVMTGRGKNRQPVTAHKNVVSTIYPPRSTWRYFAEVHE